MIDLKELLQPYYGRKMAGFCRDADVCVESGRRAVIGYNVRVKTAFKMLEHLGYEPPCKIEDVNTYIQELWNRETKRSSQRIGDALGIHYATINRWLSNHTCNPNYINFLMLCKHLSEKDEKIHNYTFGGF